MNHRKLKILLTLFCLLVLVGCNTVTPTLEPTQTKAAALPEEGMATVVGQVLDRETGESMQDTIVRLAEVHRDGDDGAYVLDVAFSPGALTDKDGFFIFENVDAMEYVIVVGDVYNVYEVITGEEGTPATWVAGKNQVTDIGQIRVDLTP